MSDHPAAVLVSVNIGEVREVEHNGRVVQTGIFKYPTTETQTVEGVHIGRDRQADTQAHGGPDKAIYAYAHEDYEWWESELGRRLEPGFFGENLTTSGVDITGAQVGDRWHIGTTILEVSEPRVPCFKLTLRSGIPRFQQAFARADRPGTYLRIVEPGQLTVGDNVEVVPTKEGSISVGDIAVTYHRNQRDAHRLLAVSRLSPAWHAWAQRAIDRATP